MLFLLLFHEVLSNSFHGLWSSIYQDMVRSRFFFDLIGMVGDVFDHEAFALCNWVFDEDEHGFFAELVGIVQFKGFSPRVSLVQAFLEPPV